MLTKNKLLDSPPSGGKEAMAMAGQDPITSGQEKQIAALAAATAKRVFSQSGGKERAQNVIESGDSLQDDLAQILLKYSVPNMYASEEVKSSLKYPKNYQLWSVQQQVERIREVVGTTFFHNFNVWHWGDEQLPLCAEGWFAIPRWQNFGSTYDKAVREVLSHKLPNWFYSTLHNVGQGNLRQLPSTAEMMEQLGYQQRGYDIILVPAQFGSLHVGRSARRTRAIFRDNEFGLGTFEACIMLWTHPERLAHFGDMEINCIGDEYRNGPKGPYTFTPCIYVGKDDDQGPRMCRQFTVWPGGSSYRADLAPITGFLPKM